MDPKEQIIKEIVEKGVFDAIGDGISIQDANFKILYQNKIHKKMFGDHVGKHCYTAYGKDEKVCKDCPLEETFRDGNIRTKERSAHTDKGMLYVEITSSPIKVPTGEIIAGIEVVRDVTKRKIMEKALHESESRFRRLVENAPMAVIIVNKNGEIEYINKTNFEMCGYTLEDVPTLERWWSCVYRDEETRKTIIGEWNIIKDKILSDEKKTIKVERNIFCKDGTAKDFELIISQFSGKLFVLFHDITERKRADESLKKSEEKYRLLFSAEQDAIIVVDAETRRIIDANDSALHLYGYTKEEILKLTGPDLSAEPEKSDAAISEIAIAPDNKIYYHTRNHEKKDGTVFPVEITSGKFMLQDRKTISAVIRDVTERKKSEKALKERIEELENFYRMAVSREIMMKQQKQEIEKLRAELSRYKK